MYVFFFKQKTADEMRISDWSSDVCSSDLNAAPTIGLHVRHDSAGEMRKTLDDIGISPIEIFVCKFVEHAGRRSHRGIDRNIGGAEHVFGFCHHPRETVECSKVSRNGDCFASFTSDGIYCAVQLLLPTRDDHHA